MGPDAVEHDVEAFRAEIRRVLTEDFAAYTNVTS
jgi:hypothetical protein